MDGLNLQHLTSHSFFVNHYTQGEFWVLDEFLRCNYSNETSSVLLSLSTTYLLITSSVCEQYAMAWPFFSTIFTWYYLLLALLWNLRWKVSWNLIFAMFGIKRLHYPIGSIFPGGLLFWSTFLHDVRERNALLTKRNAALFDIKSSFVRDLREKSTYRPQGTWSTFRSFLGSWQIVDHQLRRPGNARKGQLPGTC